MRTLTGHSDIVFSVAFSQDGNRVVSGSSDNLVKIWDTETGAEVSSHGPCTWCSDVWDCIFRRASRGVMRWKRSESGALRILQVRTLTGHSELVIRVAFSGDGAQVVSASLDSTVRFFDVASGRQVRQLAGDDFALVEGLSCERKRDRHVITVSGDTLRIYKIGKVQQHAEDGVAAAPVACFKAPQLIFSVRCVGAAICVGCDDGAVCILSAPFLAA
jgi:WD40 repeat protein